MKDDSSHSSSYEEDQFGSLKCQNSYSGRQSQRMLQRKDYARIDEPDSNQEEVGQEESEVEYFQGGKIQRVYDERVRTGTNQKQRLCKLGSCSYLHLQWLTDKEIEERNIQDVKPNKAVRLKQSEQIKQIQAKYGKHHYFNPAYTRIDRILTTSVLFPNMHHKKASEMNGKWSESLVIVCAKMLNFEKQHIAYGVVQKEDYENSQIETFNISNPLKLEHLINRLYLDKYDNCLNFWSDVGICMNNLRKVYQGTAAQHDVKILTECIIFLYWQWHLYSLQRYYSNAQQMDSRCQTLKINQPTIKFIVKRSHREVEYSRYRSNNIFLNEKKGQIPTTDKQLERVCPYSFSYRWLSSEFNYNQFVFEYLDETDLGKLDLGVQIDSLYLIKWCELDYDEVTWEKQSDLLENGCHERIKNFKLYSKVPPKKVRDKIQENKKYHKSILLAMKGELKEGVENIERYRRKLYCVPKEPRIPKQYGGEDIPIYKDYKMLKEFQLEGLNWLIRGWHQRKNCILADEMGLGKTIQTIAFLNHLTVFEDVIGPFLIVAPVSTLKQWRYQIEQWSDLNCVLYKGRSQCRQLIEEYEFYHKFVTNEGYFVNFQKLNRFQVFLTNYQLFMSDFDLIQKFAFQYIILDQGHKVKNQNTRIAKTLRKLPCPRILLLTGTPIQNNTNQVWGLLNVIEPRRFYSFEDFKQKYSKLTTTDDLKRLKQILKPYLLRRVKSDVQKTIPKLSQTVVCLDLTKQQKKLYKGILQKNKNKLIKILSSISLNNLCLNLRKCCNHPNNICQENEIGVEEVDDEERMKKLIESSCKMIFVHKFLEKCKITKQKTLIFSQFRDMIQLLNEYCELSEIKYEWLDGSVDYEERQTRIQRFNKLDEILVFVISTKAGGIGINLTSATNIIIYDSDWNPQNDIQAIARAHRIGQKKLVSVYRLITSQTYEQIIYKTAVKKLGIGLAILDDEYFSNRQSTSYKKPQKSREEIQKLLKDGVLGFLKNQETQNQAANIKNISIQQIIKNSGKSVNYETKDCSFTTTKFEYGQKQEEKIDLDDPNFWEVALKNVESPLQKLVKKLKKQSKQKWKIVEDVKQQGKLMVQANEIVYDFIRSKISMKAFNAQDERQLKSFLEEITESRQFLRAFKKIANEWLEEIEKPSRRFEKLKSEDIMELCATSNLHAKKLRKVGPINQVEDEQSKGEERFTRRNSRLKTIIKSSSSSDNEDVEKSSSEQYECNQAKNGRKRNGKIFKTHVGQQDGKWLEVNQLMSLVCSVCEKNGCSKLCTGFCNRIFHKQCYHKTVKGEQLTGNQYLKQVYLTDEELQKLLCEDFKCEDCLNEMAQCYFCNKKSQTVPFVPRTKTYHRTKIEDESEKTADNNYIQKICREASQEQKQQVFQCRMANCNKFYHLECLEAAKYTFMYEIEYVKEGECYPLKCPLHFCGTCKTKITHLAFNCTRCPVSFHQKCKNAKASSYISIYDQYCICKWHLTHQEKEKWAKHREDQGLAEEANGEQEDLHEQQGKDQDQLSLNNQKKDAKVQKKLMKQAQAQSQQKPLNDQIIPPEILSKTNSIINSDTHQQIKHHTDPQ